MGTRWQREQRRFIKKMKAEKAIVQPQEEKSEFATFHPFSRLPLELRRQIFLAALEPRVLTIYENRCTITPTPGTGGRQDDPRYPCYPFPRPRFSGRRKRAIQEYEKNSLHPWEARILNPIDQRTLAKREEVHASRLNTPHPTACFKDIWNNNSGIEAWRNPEVRTFTAADGIYPDLETVPFWDTPYFRRRIIEQTSTDAALCDIFQSQLTVRFEADTKRPFPPALFQVCRDSREVAMEHYQLAFGASHDSYNKAFNQDFEKSGLGQKQIWIDFKHDIIFMKTNVLNFQPTPSHLQIRNLAVIAKENWWRTRDSRGLIVQECEWQKRLMGMVRKPPVLETLTIDYSYEQDCIYSEYRERFLELMEATHLHLFGQSLRETFESLGVDLRLEKKGLERPRTWDWGP